MGLPRVAGCGLSLAWREWNREAPGEPLLLLHGLSGSSADWEATARHLRGRRIIALDARGHGESDWDLDEAYAGDDHFADIATALDALAVERCVLVGFSMGGCVAMMVASALPERVSRVAVVDTYPAPEMTPGSRRIAEWISGCADGGTSFDPAIARHFRAQLTAGNETRLDLWSMWEALVCPALVVRGDLSDVLPSALADQMIARQQRARLATIAGVSHAIPLVKPRELAALLARFASADEAGVALSGLA